METEPRLEDMTFEDWAALWGCDPCYDRAPRLPGDGYLFYNFAVEGNDPEFLKKFLPAVDRTIEELKDAAGCVREGRANDLEDMEALKAEVQRRLGKSEIDFDDWAKKSRDVWR